MRHIVRPLGGWGAVFVGVASIIAVEKHHSFSCWSFSHDTRLWTRRIQSQPKNIANALQVLETIPTQNALKDKKPIVEALRVCGKCERPDLALEIFQRFPSETSRIMTISVLGSCHQPDQALKLLKLDIEGMEGPTVASYNAAIAACGKSKEWGLTVRVYESMMPHEMVTTLTCNAVLTILAQCRQGPEAQRVFWNMPCPPDRLSYQYVINAMIRSGMVDEACGILDRLGACEVPIKSSGPMFDMVASAYSKDSNWKGVQRVEQIRNPDAVLDDPSVYVFQHWEGVPKIGKGKDAYWEVATITPLNITVGAQPNRNPTKNGIQLVFYENTLEGRLKLGYLLMRNSGNESSLLGMFLDGQRRGQGIAKSCLAIWVWFCIKADITPKTGIINKPLLALMLQDRLGFVPNAKRGIEIELSPDPDIAGQVLMYAPFRQSLEGAFSSSDLQHQNLRILQQRPNPPGRRVKCGTDFSVQDSDNLRDRVNQVLPDDSVCCPMTKVNLRRLYLGRD